MRCPPIMFKRSVKPNARRVMAYALATAIVCGAAYYFLRASGTSPSFGWRAQATRQPAANVASIDIETIALRPRRTPSAKSTLYQIELDSAAERWQRWGLTPESEVEICGVGNVKLVALLNDDFDRFAQAAVQSAIAAAAEELKRSRTVADQALGVYLSALHAADRAQARHLIDHPGCANDDGSFCEALLEARREAVSAAIKPLLDIAADTRDPDLYALTYHACVGVAWGAPACKAISADRWVELDPQNMVPQLQQVAELNVLQPQASTRAPTAEVTAAYRRIADSTSFAQRAPPFHRVMKLNAVISQPTFVQHLISAALLSEWILVAPVRDSLGAYRYCRADSDETRLARATECEKIANAMLEHDLTLLGRHVAVSIGKSAGWPDEKVASLRAEMRVWSKAQLEEDLDVRQRTCGHRLKQLERYTELMERGEVAMLRKHYSTR
jgi:hypothetical protein